MTDEVQLHVLESLIDPSGELRPAVKRVEADDALLILRQQLLNDRDGDVTAVDVVESGLWGLLQEDAQQVVVQVGEERVLSGLDAQLGC